MLPEFRATEESTLEDAAVAAFEGFTISQIREAIASGSITLNGRRASRSAPVAPGDSISFESAEWEPKIEPVPVDLPVLFEDESLLAVDKPAGVSVVPERGAAQWEFMGMLLHHKKRCPLCAADTRYRIVHRLDRDTTGVVAIAKTADAERALTQRFADRVVAKRYLALVAPTPRDASGAIDAPLGPGSGSRVMAVREGGKPSVTDWRVLERFKGFALLEVSPHTGRTHQIRVHLAYAGTPLAVDPMYGGAESVLLSAIKKGYKRRGDEKPLIDRLTLHCASLEFPHPVTGAPLSIAAPLPGDFERVLKPLRKWASDKYSR